MNMKQFKISLYYVDGFGIGFEVLSYKYNNCISLRVSVGPFVVSYWPKAQDGLVGFVNCRAYYRSLYEKSK